MRLKPIILGSVLGLCSINSALAARDPIKWPFARTSIWNMPIGSDAQYVHARIQPSQAWGMTAEENVVIMLPQAPLVPLYYSSVGWSSRQEGARCAPTGGKMADLPIPKNFVVPHNANTMPNFAAGVLMPDGRTIRNFQPFTRCQRGGVATALVEFPSCDLFGDGINGAQGGSGLSSIGGTIRLGELKPGNRIRHALKLTLFARKYLAYRQDGTPGYRFPARKADSYAKSNYGGQVPDLEMGALLALKPDFDIASLRTEPARIIARALMDYGGYVVDDTAWDVYGIAVERGPNGRVLSEFKKHWGYDFASPKQEDNPWVQDMATIFTALHVVANNAPDAIGGGGTPRRPLAPPF